MARQFQIGDWLIEPELNRITRAGAVTPMEPKVLEVLEFLAKHPGEVLSKEQIVRSVWPATYVSDGILSYSISRLRKALGDDARIPEIIQTIARKGYRLIAPVTMLGSNQRHVPSVAVLSFFDMSPEKDQEHFCDGIAEEIINNLMMIKDLRVAARTSSFAFKGKNDDVRVIGRKLNVDAVMEGSVRKSGDAWRISVQLSSVEDGCHIWGARYDRQPRDVFAIQDEISRSIAAALTVTFHKNEEHEGRKSASLNSELDDYYQRGRRSYHLFTRKGIEAALLMFEQSVEMDPGRALPYAGIADCCTFLYLYAGGNRSHRRRAVESSGRAIELDPSSAAAHASRGAALSLGNEFAAAESSFETSLRLGPPFIEGYHGYARMAIVQGRPEKAVKLYELASEANPQDYQSPLLAARIYADLARPEEAEICRLRGVHLAEARLTVEPNDARALYLGANGLVALGQREMGLIWISQALELDPSDPMILYNAACVEALAGQVEDAFITLERALENGLADERWLERDGNLNPLRSHPRFSALMARMKDQSMSEIA